MYDVYGNRLRKGHCEVHPKVAEEYPCFLCIQSRKEFEDRRKEKRNHSKNVIEVNAEAILTKREYFAGLAMQGGWYDMTDAGMLKHYEYTAKACVAMADALLAALEEQ